MRKLYLLYLASIESLKILKYKFSKKQLFLLFAVSVKIEM